MKASSGLLKKLPRSGALAVRRKKARSRSRSNEQAYPRFRQIDGRHSFKQSVPGAFIDYGARVRRGGKVAYFNFGLAKEMGLVPSHHSEKLNAKLSKAILDTFAIQIINEYDIIHKTAIPAKDRLPGRYMATRYLQLQHPDRRGVTSGDGRSIWNGQISHRGVTWDISSCGTGATALSPATAIEKKYFKTGDPKVSYGCGYADLSDGISAAIMSEILYQNGVETERTLAVLEFERGLSINVRAGKNLIRPSHFFSHLKQGNYSSLKAVADYYIDRQVSNGEWEPRSGDKKYTQMAEKIAIQMARATARFETDYLFVWLDWDGDNVLTNGGIIDYGSVRQFGLYHHEYRYDDVDRMSTTIPEQREKARYLVQTFAQMRDYLIHGKKRTLKSFSRDSTLKVFEREFERALLENLLYRLGLPVDQSRFLMERHGKLVKDFKKIHSYFEKAKSSRGVYKVGDGITCDAIYCMRDILRELPLFLLSKKKMPTPAEFHEIILSSYATRRDRKLDANKTSKIEVFKSLYWKIVETVSKRMHRTTEQVLLEMSMRSSVINRYDRITGESVIGVTCELLRQRKRKGGRPIQQVIEEFIEYQRVRPEKRIRPSGAGSRSSKKVMENLIALVHTHREDI